MGSKLSLFLLYRQRFSRYRSIFKIAITWPLAKDQEVAHTLILPIWGWNWAYFIQAAFSTSSGCCSTGKLGHSSTHIQSLSIPGGQNWAYFWSMGCGFREMVRLSKLSYMYLDMKLGHWQKFQKLYTPVGTLFLMQGVEIARAHFCSRGSGFKDTGRYPKLPCLGMKLNCFTKIQKLHILVTPFLPQGVEIELTFSLWVLVSEIRAVFTDDTDRWYCCQIIRNITRNLIQLISW